MAVRTKTQLEAEIRSKLESAGTPRISAAELRSVFKDFLDSMALEAGLKPFARSGGPQVPDTEIPAGIMRDSEFTQAAVLSLLGLTTQELNDLLTGASLSGGVLTFPQNDGTNISITLLPRAVGGGGTADGVVSSAAFSNDGMTLTLTLSTGTTVQASVPAVLRQAGLSQSQVQALINAAEADDLDAADVAAQIQAAVMSRRIPEAPGGGGGGEEVRTPSAHKRVADVGTRCREEKLWRGCPQCSAGSHCHVGSNPTLRTAQRPCPGSWTVPAEPQG